MNFLQTYKTEIDQKLGDFFEKYPYRDTGVSEKTLRNACEYAVMLGGKRIRPILGLVVFEVFQDIEISRKQVIKNLISLELIHAYSLVHDDLPALDNDILRRGDLSVWKKYGEEVAILTGDMLLTMAFENLAKNSPEYCIKKLFNILSKASGINGMIGGQMRDLDSENKEITVEELTLLHQKKTGALLVASAQFGAVLAKISNKYYQKITKYAQKLGLAFQIKDDLLDKEGDSEIVGKTVGKDEKGFVKILGIAESKKRLSKLIKESIEIAKEFKSQKLEFLAKFVEEREK